MTRAGASLLVLLGALRLSGCASGSEPAPSPSPSPSPAPTPGVTCGTGSPLSGMPSLTSRLVLGGLTNPVDLQSPPGDCALYVLEQAGRIRIIRRGAPVAPPFLDIVSRVGSGDERGLLGLAFHPQYATNGRFFVNYTDRSGDTHISEFRVSGNPDVADPGSERLLIFVDQPFSNHNGGGLAFGNDGMLYVGLGDGGSTGDPLGNGQSRGTLLGKLLRIDVDRGSPYAVPADNPFVSTAGARPEIWAYGFHNPWRFAFDRTTGDLLIADVGQNQVEEIDLGQRVANYGWNTWEGSSCFRSATGCPTAGFTFPIVEYRHDEGCSVTGGVVYRGAFMPGHAGTYFYSDFCSGFVRSFRLQGGRAVDQRDWTAALGRGRGRGIVSFGVDGAGEVYIVDHGGEIYKIVPAS